MSCLVNFILIMLAAGASTGEGFSMPAMNRFGGGGGRNKRPNVEDHSGGSDGVGMTQA